MAFWILAHTLYDPRLHSIIAAEVRREFNDQGLVPAVNFEARLDNCKHLMAVYNELLRIQTASASIRSVDEDTELGPFLLRKGSGLLIPYRQMHFDEANFGADAANFNAERFLQNEGMDRNTAFRPFGGGMSYCAGRSMAKREILGFVAIALSQLDIELPQQLNKEGEKMNGISGKQPFPKCNDRMPSLGVLPPSKGEDLVVTVRKRYVDAGS